MPLIERNGCFNQSAASRRLEGVKFFVKDFLEHLQIKRQICSQSFSASFYLLRLVKRSEFGYAHTFVSGALSENRLAR